MTLRPVGLWIALLSTVVFGCQPAQLVARGCPTALLSGILAERDGGLVVITEGDGQPAEVAWPSGHSVRDDAGHLVVVDGSGRVVARQGDRVDLTGGQSAERPEVFEVCEIEVGQPPPP